jgi:hypothetical protein
VGSQVEPLCVELGIVCAGSKKTVTPLGAWVLDRKRESHPRSTRARLRVPVLLHNPAKPEGSLFSADGRGTLYTGIEGVVVARGDVSFGNSGRGSC